MKIASEIVRPSSLLPARLSFEHLPHITRSSLIAASYFVLNEIEDTESQFQDLNRLIEIKTRAVRAGSIPKIEEWRQKAAATPELWKLDFRKSSATLAAKRYQTKISSIEFLIPNLGRDELRAKIDGTVDARSLARLLNLRTTDICDFVEAKLFTPLNPHSKKRYTWQFEWESIVKLYYLLQEKIVFREEIGRSITLHELIKQRAMLEFNCSIPDLILAVLNRQVYATNIGESLYSLTFPIDEIYRFFWQHLTHQIKDFSADTAAKYLGISSTDIGALVATGFLSVRSVKSFEAEPRTKIDRKSIEDLIHQYLIVAPLAREIGLSIEEIECALHELGFVPIQAQHLGYVTPLLYKKTEKLKASIHELYNSKSIRSSLYQSHTTHHGRHYLHRLYPG